MEKPIIFLLLTLFLMISTKRAFEFEPVSYNLGAFLVKIKDAYISHSSWRLLYHYDLTDFYENVNSYKECLVKLNEICDRLEEMNESAQCLALIRKHKSFLEDINIDIEYLEVIQNEGKMKKNQKRRTRDAPLGFITTYALKPLFGIMSEEDAEELAAKINELTENQQAHHTILDHNLSIISRTIETTNDTMFEFIKGMEEMSSFIKKTIIKLNEMEEGIDLHISFTYISSLVKNIKIEYTKAINVIKRVIQNKLIGEYTEIMTYELLTRDLQEIEQEFDDARVKLLTDPIELQNSISITGAIVKRKLLIELMVPIVDRSIYTLEKIIKLPMRDGEQVFVFEIPHINHLVQNEARLFIPMQSEDLEFCHELTRKKLLCYPQRDTHYADDSSFESNILFNQPQKIINSCTIRPSRNTNWVIGLNDNQHYISPRDNVTIIEKCIGQIPNKASLDRPGIIKLDVNCELYTDKIIVYPKYTRTRAGIINLPVANRTQGIKIRDLKSIGGKLKELPPSPKTVFENFNEEFIELDEEITNNRKTLNDLKPVQPLERHPIRNTIIGIIIVIILIIAKGAARISYFGI